MSSYEDYPVAVIEDRYGGVYSGGKWLAIAQASDLLTLGNTRAQFCLIDDNGPSGADGEAAEFWVHPPSWIAPGFTAEAAIQNLRSQSASGSKPNA